MRKELHDKAEELKKERCQFVKIFRELQHEEKKIQAYTETGYPRTEFAAMLEDILKLENLE